AALSSSLKDAPKYANFRGKQFNLWYTAHSATFASMHPTLKYIDRRQHVRKNEFSNLETVEDNFWREKTRKVAGGEVIDHGCDYPSCPLVHLEKTRSKVAAPVVDRPEGEDADDDVVYEGNEETEPDEAGVSSSDDAAVEDAPTNSDHPVEMNDASFRQESLSF
ncbi:hypothetical protein PENTCL1PPCAC_25942, partial [Pristionchus entomophagus]